MSAVITSFQRWRKRADIRCLHISTNTERERKRMNLQHVLERIREALERDSGSTRPSASELDPHDLYRAAWKRRKIDSEKRTDRNELDSRLSHTG